MTYVHLDTLYRRVPINYSFDWLQQRPPKESGSVFAATSRATDTIFGWTAGTAGTVWASLSPKSLRHHAARRSMEVHHGR